MFSFKRLKAIYDYGWKILAVGLVDTFFGQIRSLVIAKQYSKADLAYYNRGYHFAGFGMQLVEPTISAVLFPALSSCNDNPKLMKSVTQRVIKSSTYLICCIMFMLAAISKPLIIVLLTEKWSPSIIFLQIGCMAYLLRPLQVINNCVIRASGRSGLLLKLDLVKKGIGVALLIASMSYGVEAIAWSLVLTNVIATVINIYPNKDILKYGYVEQFKDLAGNMLLGAVVAGIVWLITLLPIGYFPMLVLQIIVGLSLILIFSELLKLDSYKYLKETFFNTLKKSKK